MRLRSIYYKDCKHFGSRTILHRADECVADVSVCSLEDNCPCCNTPLVQVHPKLWETGCPLNCKDYKEE